MLFLYKKLIYERIDALIQFKINYLFLFVTCQILQMESMYEIFRGLPIVFQKHGQKVIQNNKDKFTVWFNTFILVIYVSHDTKMYSQSCIKLAVCSKWTGFNIKKPFTETDSDGTIRYINHTPSLGESYENLTPETAHTKLMDDLHISKLEYDFMSTTEKYSRWSDHSYTGMNHDDNSTCVIKFVNSSHATLTVTHFRTGKETFHTAYSMAEINKIIAEIK